MPTYKDINLLTQKSAMAGTEKLPVSDTEYITPDQIVEDLDLEVFGSVQVTKDYQWSEGYVSGAETVVSSSASRFCQPILFKAGEKITYKTGADYTRAVVKVADATPIAVGSSGFVQAVLINAPTPNVQHEYVFTEDTYVVISIYWASYTLITEQYNSESINNRIASIDAEVSPLSFSKTYASGSYPTTDTSIGFGANAGQKLILTCTSTGSLGYGWFITGKKPNGAIETILSRYSAATNYELSITDNYEELFFRMASGNTGDATVNIALYNWRSYVSDTLGDIATILASI